jgi:hypothetical protein
MVRIIAGHGRQKRVLTNERGILLPGELTAIE